MIDEQEFNIPLDSPLDVNMGDTLMSAKEPKFSFNRQRNIGGSLQTSVRFEDDGWFAGWLRHNFVLVNTGDNYIEPPFSGSIEEQAKNLLIQNKVTDRGVLFYAITEKVVGLSMLFVPVQWENWSLGTGTVTRDLINTNELIISGATQFGDVFSVVIDVYTLVVISATLPADYFVTVDRADAGIMILIDRVYSAGADWFTVRKDRQLKIGKGTMAYKASIAESIWGITDDVPSGEFKLNHSTGIVTEGADGSFNIDTQTGVLDAGTKDERVEVTYKDESILKVEPTVEYTSKWRTASYISADPLGEFIGRNRVNSNVNVQKTRLLSTVNNGAYNSQANIVHALPIWAWHRFTGILCYLRFIAGTPDYYTFEIARAPSSGRVSAMYALPADYVIGTPEIAVRMYSVDEPGAVQKDTGWQNPFAGPPLTVVAGIKVTNSDDHHTNWRLLFRISNGATPLIAGTQPNAELFTIEYSMQAPMGMKYSAALGDTEPVPLGELIKSVSVKSNDQAYYEMLNKEDLDPLSDLLLGFTLRGTTSLVYAGETHASVYSGDLIIPHCMYGYSVYKVASTNIVNGDISAFTLTELTNSAAGIAACVRVDKEGQVSPTLSGIILGIVEPVLQSIQMRASDTEQNITVALNSISGRVLYISTVGTGVIDNVGGGKVPVPRVYPPLFTYSYLPTSIIRTELNSGVYSASVIAIDLGLSKFIDTTAFNFSLDRTPYNSDVFDLVSPVARVSDPPTINQDNYTLRIVIRENSAFPFDPLDPDDPAYLAATDYIDYAYNVVTGYMTTPSTVHLLNYSFVSGSSSVPAVNDVVQKLVIAIRSIEQFVAALYRGFVVSKNGFVTGESLDVQSQEFGELVLTNNYGKIQLATDTLDPNSTLAFVNAVDVADGTRYYIAKRNAAEVETLPAGIIRKPDSVEYISHLSSVTHYEVIFNVAGELFNRTLFIDRESELNLYYETKDIRNNEEPKFVYKNNLKGIFMFIKQQWSDAVEVENYWWVDKNHMLVLTESDIMLIKKVEEVVDGVTRSAVDDWMGDKWEIATEVVEGQTKNKKVPRQQFFGIDDIYYNVSSAKNAITGPAMYKLRPVNNTIEIWQIRDILNCTFTKMSADSNQWLKSYVDVVKLNFGFAPQLTDISAYIELQPAALLSTASISSTVVGSTFMLGIAYGKGLLQWTIKIPIVGMLSVITGYGYVGLDGSLTGGQIPSLFCTTSGFIGEVRSIEELKNVVGSANINSPFVTPTLPESVCYGTGSKVWFVSKQVDSIISHFIYDSSANIHRPIKLMLRSVVDRRYEASSFQAHGLFDALLPPLSFTMLFENILKLSPGIKLLADFILPVLFYLDLKYAMFAYINHSFGQYAYVWRNSTKDYMPDGKTDQEIKFLQDKYTQTFEQNANLVSTIVNIMLKGIEFADAIPAEYKANQSQNQVTSDDSRGRKLSQFFVEAVSGTVGDLLVSSGTSISIKSTVAQAFTLGMFYAISDNDECHAGPGFVNHNFIGQCVAQSVTDTQLTGKRFGYWCTLKTLSEVVVGFKLFMLEAIQKGLYSLSESIGNFSIDVKVLGTGTSIPLGSIFAGILNAAAIVIQAVIVLNREGLKVLGQLADAVGPSTGKAYAAGTLQKYNLDVEGTHSYGNKPMSFFWPAFGVDLPLRYTNEWVESRGVSTSQSTSFSGRHDIVEFDVEKSWTKGYDNEAFIARKGKMPLTGSIKTVTIKNRGVAKEEVAPNRMAVVEGAKTFMSPELFRNEQIDVGPAVFPPPPIHDYSIDDLWKLGITAGKGEIIWVSCDDTKLIDGPPSNIVITTDFCGIASSYTAIEIKKEYDHRYLRPWAVTPQAMALNINKINCVHDGKPYHAFDGQGNRIIKWTGGTGMDKAMLYQQYQFQVNDHFKRSNILPPSQFFGIFEGPPVVAMNSIATNENVANLVQSLTKRQGIKNEIPGEYKDLARFAIPVHSRQLSTLPAMVRMLAPYKLNVIEGITSLTTEVRTTQTKYKAPSSVDFNIYSKLYRATDEFLCEIQTQDGIVAIRDICATAGLRYIGATTREAFFYSPATRLYYSFADGREIVKVNIMSRFFDVTEAKWDFINQEVMLKALLNSGTLVIRLDHDVLGEVFPPNDTIYNANSDYLLLSMPGGTVFQGPRRFIVNRFILLDYMIPDIKYYSRRAYSPLYPAEFDKKNWKRVSREEYDQFRDYGWKYYNRDSLELTTDLMFPAGTVLQQDSVWWAIHGWTHNPLGLVTGMVGLDNNVDCKFEWVITFGWTDQMDKLFDNNMYITVNVMAETVTLGGVVKCRPTPIFLSKESFTREGNAGYYTFKFQSTNGTGNRERLYVWSDGIAAIQDIKVRIKPITENRTQPLYVDNDVKDLTEM